MWLFLGDPIKQPELLGDSTGHLPYLGLAIPRRTVGAHDGMQPLLVEANSNPDNLICGGA